VRPLVATYRLQLGPDLDLHAAAGLVGHLADLGVSHLYLSPVLEARAGSTHGYDVTDPRSDRAELGGRAALDALAAAAHAAGLGLLLDVVPNHLAADARNPWWWSVLREGRASPDARVFDIDWDLGDDRVLLPVLGRPLADVIARGELTVDPASGEPVLRSFDRTFPLSRGTDVAAPLTDVLERQHYRLLDWHVPERNVRRFFDIDDLLGVRVEDAEVFAMTHALVLELVLAGVVDALRVDHVDGLRDPAAYLGRVAREAQVPVLVEKILGPDEALPPWPVAGTTGYEHLADLDALFVDGDGLRAIDVHHRRHGGREFDAIDRAARRQVLAELFPSEWTSRACEAAADLGTDRDDAAAALADLTVALDVYRTYLVDGTPAAPGDRDALALATSRVGPDTTAGALATMLRDGHAGTELTARWQQLTGAVMAKGHEDTASYRDPRLLALDEVGGDPDGPLRHDPVPRFHARQAARLADGRAGLTPTTTHDTKRSEDARSRLLALSEVAPEWLEVLDALRDALPARLDAVEVATVAQTLLAVWPLDGIPTQEFEGRVGAYLVKALRERKETTSWRAPDADHEQVVLDAVHGLLADGGRELDRRAGALRARIEPAAAATSLARLVLKHAAPGTPDVYRGTERWALDLADPDNRRPVDHGPDVSTLRAWRGTPPAPAELRRSWRDGRVKLWCTWRTLAARRADPDLFLAGGYRPLIATGHHADAVVAFAREHRGRVAVAVAACRGTRPAGPDGFPVGDGWDDTRLEGVTVDALRTVLDPDAGPLRSSHLRDLLRELPAALLVG
jgi:malto-oligosyltrehalose synthase